ncbi:uncharacterized protein [Setaria viridis]|nr:uncharacterized protein LOC117847888 isoform X3 [Setaria viridis]
MHEVHDRSQLLRSRSALPTAMLDAHRLSHRPHGSWPSTLGGFHVTSFLQRCWPFLDCCNLGFAHLNFLSRDNKTKKHNLMCANGALLKIGAVHG